MFYTRRRPCIPLCKIDEDGNDVSKPRTAQAGDITFISMNDEDDAAAPPANNNSFGESEVKEAPHNRKSPVWWLSGLCSARLFFSNFVRRL